MWHDLLAAIALLLIAEGILPFLSPDRLRKAVLQISQLNDGTLRFVGLTSMVGGCLLLYLIR